MWPFNNKVENKGFTLAPGESVDIGFYVSWRVDKNEALIVTDRGSAIVDENSEIFIEIDGDNIGTAKFQIVPDFKNRVLDLVEVIDIDGMANIDDKKRSTGKDGPILTFGNTINERYVSFDDYVKHWDQVMEKLKKIVKRSKWIRNILIPASVASFILSLYDLMTGGNVYINIFTMVVSICMIYYILNLYKRSLKEYVKYDEYKGNIFGIVKRE